MDRKEAPRFHPQTELPTVGEGQILVKFHGRPAVIPDGLGEEKVGRSRFTRTQASALQTLENERIQKIRDELALNQLIKDTEGMINKSYRQAMTEQEVT